MRYYWFNRQELLQKVKDKYHNCGDKEKAAEYYLEYKDVSKNKQRKSIKTCQKKKKKKNENMKRIDTEI